MTTPTVKPGDDIAWSGQITSAGVSDFTGYILTSQIRLRDANTGSLTTLLGTATIAWTDAVAGVFSYFVGRAVTAPWPADACLVLDIKVASPDGKWSRTETAEVLTEAGVTA